MDVLHSMRRASGRAPDAIVGALEATESRQHFPALTPPVGHCPEEGRDWQSTGPCCSQLATTSERFNVLC